MNAKIIVGLILSVAALGGAAYMFLAPADHQAETEIESTPPPARKKVASAKTDDPNSMDRPDAIDTSTFSESNDDAFSSEEMAEEEEGLRFALVTDLNGNPVAGAKVRLLASDQGGGRGRGGRGWMQFLGGASNEPTVYRTVKSGRDGFALLSPLPRRRFVVEARSGDTLGSERYEQGAEEDAEELPEGADLVVALHPIKKLRIEVVDEGGGPAANVRVSAQRATEEENNGGNPWRRMGRGQQNVSAWTMTPNGTIEMEISKANAPLYDAKKVEVRAHLPGFDQVTNTAPMAEAGVTQVSLRIPTTTALKINLVDFAGKPHTDTVDLSWMIDPASLPKSGNEDSTNNRRGRRGGPGGMGDFMTKSLAGTRKVTGGSTTLGGFMPGASVTFTTRAEGRLAEYTTIKIGQLAKEEFQVAVGDTEAKLKLTVTDPAGKPVINTRLRFNIDLDSANDTANAASNRGMMRFMTRGDRSPRATTNGKGQVTLSAKPRSAGQIEVFSEQGRRGFGRDAQTKALASMRFAKLEPGETRDLGEMRLNDFAVIAAGVVVDGEGEPVVNATVSFTASGQTDRGGRGGRGGRGRGGRGGMQARTDSSGAFIVFGIPQEGTTEMSATASTRSQRSASVSFAPGAKDLRLIALGTGGLKGSLRLADPSMKLRPEVRLISAATPDERGQNLRLQGMKFTGRRLAAGNYDLKVFIQGIESAVVRGITVPEGDAVSPASIQELIVGQEFYTGQVTVLDGSGNPINRARVSFDMQTGTQQAERGRGGRGRGGRGGRGTRTDEKGIAEAVLHVGTPVKITVTAEGFATAITENASFPLTVTMDGGTKLTVTLPIALPENENIRMYRAYLEPANRAAAAPGAGAVNWRSMFGGGNNSKGINAGADSVTFDNVAAGEWEVMFFPLPGRGGRDIMRTLSPISLGKVTVTKGTPEVKLAASIDIGAVIANITQAVGGN